MEKENLPEGWVYATVEESQSLWNELQTELSQRHLLFEKPVQVIAHRRGATDDILCKHIDEADHYTVIHLTWSMKTEIDERFPMVEVDGSFSEFVDYESNFIS